MPHEIASNILAENPTDPRVLYRLAKFEGVPQDNLDTMQRTHRMVIEGDLDELESMVSMSRVELGSDGTEGAVAHTTMTEFEAAYDEVRHDPVAKFEFDIEYIHEFFLKLGPTNTMRESKNDIDGSFEISMMRRLLQNDFEAIPEGEKRPELRITEALLTEELALLWTPEAAKTAENASEYFQPLIANTKDKNALEPSQMSLPPEDRWKLIGARLSEEARDLYQEIALSPTATNAEKYEAICRASDMEIRQLAIRAGMTSNRDQHQDLNVQIKQTAYATLQAVVKAWVKPELRYDIGPSKLFEMMVLVNERRKLIRANQLRHVVRLALPREDTTHERIGMPSGGGMKINLSADVVVENIGTGQFEIGYNAKNMSPEEHAELQASKVASGRRASTPERVRVEPRYWSPDIEGMLEKAGN